MGITKEKSVGHFSWKDPYAWMESMRGSHWNALIQKQKKLFESKCTDEVQSDAAHIAAELDSSVSSVKPLQIGTIAFERDGTFHYTWSHRPSNDSKNHECADLDIGSESDVWQVADSSDGAEQYTLSHWRKGKKIWSHTKPLGPFVAVSKGRVYVIESENFLWFCRLVSFNAEDGSDRKLIVEIKDPRWNMTLLKGEDGVLFLMANNAGVQKLWHIDGSDIKDLTENGKYEAFIPVGKGPSYFARKSGSDIYEAIGAGFKSLKLPSLQGLTPQSCFLKDKLLITRRYGKRSLWDLQSGKKLDEVIGDFEIEDLVVWKGLDVLKALVIGRPGFEACLYSEKDRYCSYVQTTHYSFAKSRDGTGVPYVVVSQCHKPRALLMIGYGGYGISTGMSTSRWKPLLRRGFAIGFALVRGGGDHTDAWAEAARRDQKVKSIEDLEACIRGAQSKFGLQARNTALYGRSAGGYLMGAMLPRHPNGDLFGAVYVEVPYVDVFNTTTNVTLPLTQMEYNEFGDPLHRLKDAAAILHLSPIDALGEEGAPGVWVLSRTGREDKEVFAYESVKWITTLQDKQKGIAKGEDKILAFTEAEGHFVTGPAAKKERALDLALLLSRVPGNKKYMHSIYKMNAVATRRNRKDRKDRKDRKNNNVAVLGGKRRATRKNRKNRKSKATRRH